MMDYVSRPSSEPIIENQEEVDCLLIDTVKAKLAVLGTLDEWISNFFINSLSFNCECLLFSWLLFNEAFLSA